MKKASVFVLCLAAVVLLLGAGGAVNSVDADECIGVPVPHMPGEEYGEDLTVQASSPARVGLLPAADSETASSESGSASPEAASGSSDAPEDETNEPEEPDFAELAQEVFELVNRERSKRGFPALEYQEQLESGAMLRAEELSLRFSHTRPNGTAFYTAFGVESPGWCVENAAFGYPTPSEVVANWVRSDEHRTLLLDEDWNTTAVGVWQCEDGTRLWTQVFCHE